MILRPYQEIDLKNIVSLLSSGEKLVYRLDTGGGKTIVLTHVIKDHLEKGGKVLVLAHRERLLSQMKDRLLDIGINSKILMKNEEIEENDKVLLSTMQSASVDKRLEKLSHFSPTLVVIDECHRSVSNSYKKILNILLTESCLLLGVTATPNRLDGTSLSDIYTFLLESSITREELIKQGYLLDVDYFSSPPVDYSTVKKNKNGEFLLTGLEDKIDTESNTEKIIKSFKKYGGNKSTIVFAISIKHAKNLKEAFVKNGYKTEVLSIEVKEDERQKILSEFSKTIQILICVEILTEGVDLPECECVLLCRPTQSLALYLQMVGRALRPNGKMEKAKILDPVGMLHLHGHPNDRQKWSLYGQVVPRNIPKIVIGNKEYRRGVELECSPVENISSDEYFSESKEILSALSDTTIKVKGATVIEITKKILSDAQVSDFEVDYCLTNSTRCYLKSKTFGNFYIELVQGVLPNVISYPEMMESIPECIISMERYVVIGKISEVILKNRLSYASSISHQSTEVDDRELSKGIAWLRESLQDELESYISSLLSVYKKVKVSVHGENLNISRYVPISYRENVNTWSFILTGSKLLKKNMVTIVNENLDQKIPMNMYKEELLEIFLKLGKTVSFHLVESR